MLDRLRSPSPCWGRGALPGTELCRLLPGCSEPRFLPGTSSGESLAGSSPCFFGGLGMVLGEQKDQRLVLPLCDTSHAQSIWDILSEAFPFP